MKLGFFILFFILTIFSSCGSMGKVDNTQQSPVETTVEIIAPDNQADAVVETTTIVGRVVIYGNEPFTFVGIVDEKGTEYAVYPRASEDALRNLQGHLIEFTVIMLDESGGLPLGEGSLYLRGGTVTPVSWTIIR